MHVTSLNMGCQVGKKCLLFSYMGIIYFGMGIIFFRKGMIFCHDRPVNFSFIFIIRSIYCPTGVISSPIVIIPIPSVIFFISCGSAGGALAHISLINGSE